MEFGVPSKKRVKSQKYPNTPVITLLKHEGGKASRKIEFNNKAYEVLGLVKNDYNKVAFSFNPSDMNSNMLVNAKDINTDAALKVAKNGIVSNKAHYEEIKNRLNTDMDEELELKLQDSGNMFKDSKVFTLVPMSEETSDADNGVSVDISSEEEIEDDGSMYIADLPEDDGSSYIADPIPTNSEPEKVAEPQAQQKEEEDEFPF
jgi:hypothetical protein